MNNSIKFTSSQILYMLCMLRLSHSGCGVKNIELATSLDYSKPSVHNMLKSLAEIGVLTQEIFGLSHFINEGRALAIKYECCFHLLGNKMNEICGDNATTEIAICGILADMSLDKINRLTNRAEGDVLNEIEMEK